MAEAREVPPGSFLSKLTSRGGRGPSELRKWFAANWTTLFMLALLFGVALFVRTYFGYDTATEGYYVSGGSDSYYWQRIIDYSAETGKQLYWDPLINYPDGIRNPRPPFYSMSIVVPGVFAQGLYESLDDSLGMSLLWSTAFWGALTIIPTYFLGKETFGRRAGIVAAFFLAVMPAHVQRSVFSDADHDSFILFFIVLTFYFFLRAVKTQEHRRWVENWRSWTSIKGGLGDYFRNSRTPVMYSLMAGVAYGAVIMAWVGFGYVAVLILAYYVIQILLNKFKGFDSTSVTIIVFLAMGFGYLLSFPVYYEQSLIPVRFDVPVYLFAVAIVFGLLFVISRDYPWTLTLPAIFIVVAVGILAINAVDPSLAEAILSGQGYFSQSKLYSTIAEARAPAFSELAMSFGMVTFFLSMIGLVWAIVKIPKKATAEFIFIVVWLGAAIFMAISAGRFMFNAAPAFAIAAAWVTVIIVDRLDFNSVRKSLTGASGSYLQVFRKSVKIRHVVGVLFLAFMVVLPNVWYGTDAGIPSENKALLDKEIYDSIPSFMRPSGYDDVNGSNWYLGAFGYSIPISSYYFPAAWEWFSEYDSDIPAAVDRPAYVSWWDYGFEAVQAGSHPTVADNFQNGYEMAGNIILAQSEAEVVALFSYRLVQTANGDPDLKPGLLELFEKYGVSSDRMAEVLSGDVEALKAQILEDPTMYGPMDSDLGGTNARIVAGRVELVKLGLENLVAFYGDLVELTGHDIRYFSVDSRMFPRSGMDTGIFYAPAKLADRRIVMGSTPIDFYEIKAVDQYGREVSLDAITSDMVIQDYTLTYQPMFYNSTFYRAMCGVSGFELGASNDGIPGLSGSGSLSSEPIMPGWNMTHFRMVYRTAYYNPYPISEIPFHRDAWRAVSLEEAEELSAKVRSGEIDGYVDDSGSSYYSAGVVFLEYYKGAFVNGTVTTEEGYPVANVRVTVLDEYGIPHMTTLTDAEGRYSTIVPFGEVTLALSTGLTIDSQLRGSNAITEIVFNVTDDQAMRMRYDLDGDGILDYIMTKDYEIEASQFTADIFWDMNADGNFTAGTDELITGVTAFAKDLVTGSSFEINASEGTIDTVLPPGQYDIWAQVSGVNLTIGSTVNITAGEGIAQDLAIRPCNITGYLTYTDGTAVKGADVVIRELTVGYERSATTNDNGAFTLTRLLSGEYKVTTTEPGYTIVSAVVAVEPGEELEQNFTVFPEATVNGRVLMAGVPAPYAMYMLVDVYDPWASFSGMADADGRFEVNVPEGLWTLYAVYSSGEDSYAGAKTLDLWSAESYSTTVSVTEASEVLGGLRNPKGIPVVTSFVTFEALDGTRIPARVDSLGVYKLYLPYGTYELTAYSTSEKGLYSGTVTVQTPTSTIPIQMVQGVLVDGAVWLDSDGMSSLIPTELGRYTKLVLTDSSGGVYMATADEEGTFALVYPKSSEATLRSGNPGYSEWSVTSEFATDTSDIGVVVSPDAVLVQGRVTYDGLGLRGISVTFLPQGALLDAITVVSGSGGYFTADLNPGLYSAVVNQDTNPMGGERYMSDGELSVLPSSDPLEFELIPDRKVEVSGYIFGAASDLELRFTGPETRTLEIGMINYSLYLLPGEYRVYSTGTLSNATYANISSVSVAVGSQTFDFQLYPSHALYGSLRVEGRTVSKPATVTAVSVFGETVEVTATGGTYSVQLPQGEYTVSYVVEDVKSSTTGSLYVEYYASASAVIGSANVKLDPLLEMRLDNITVSGTVYGVQGTPVQASIELVKNSVYGQGLEVETDSVGRFSVDMQPGDYTVYVTRLQDKSAAIFAIELERNTPEDVTVDMSVGSYLSGRVVIADVGAALDIDVVTGDAKLEITSDSSGYFSMLVPNGEYSLSSSTTRVEYDMTVTYSGSLDVTVDDGDSYVTLTMIRDTKRSLSASWDKNLTQTVPPGVKVKYAFTATNTGNIEDSWTATYSGSAVSVTFVPSTFTVGLGTDSQVTIIAEVEAKSTTAAGEQQVSVLLRSKTQSSARASLSLYLNVSEVHQVSVTTANKTNPMTGWSTITKFSVNNTGNVKDSYSVSVSNLGSLADQGWSARIVDLKTGLDVTQVTVSAFTGKDLAVNFTATRSTPDTDATALVLASSLNETAVSTYGVVPVQLPDLLVGPGDITAERNDISYVFDASKGLLNISLTIALVSLVAMIFILRRKKGLGGGAKK